MLACGPEDPLELMPWVGSSAAPITDGKPYNGHPSVGYLMVPKGPALGMCTATLVGKRTVLTAAHCIPPGSLPTLVLGGLYYSSVATVQHHGWNNYSLANDIGLVKLAKEPPVTPSVVANSPIYTGLKVTLVGYGITSSNKRDSGTKRIATNSISNVYATRFVFRGSGGGIGNTCQGDSGGPAFAILNGKEVQVGVTSAGTSPCGNDGIDTRVDAFYSWLLQQSGGDLWAGKPDLTPPKVTISTPKDGDQVVSPFTVKADATDDDDVVAVYIFLNGVNKGKRTAAPWNYGVSLAPGKHQVKLVAVDKKGRQGIDQVTVTVVAPGPYGSSCVNGPWCQSGMCARDPASETRYCTIKCDPGNNACPGDAECLPAGSMSVCGPALDQPGVEGGCRINAARPGVAALLALMLLGLIVARRRRTL